MLKQRILTAAILAPLAIAALFLLPLPGFHLAMVIVCLIAAWEWTGFSSPKSTNKRKLQLAAFGLAIAGISTLLPSNVLPRLIEEGSTFIVLALAGLWWFISLILVLNYPKSDVLWRNNIVVTFIMGCLTIIPFLWAMLALHSWHYQADLSDNYDGSILLLYVMLLVWGADTGAYFCGRAFGKHKLAPNVSPAKTLEGLAGGIATAMVIAVLFSSLVDLDWQSIPVLMVASVVAVLASALGDLNESMFKRTAGIKDSGKILPGHGGVLDRIDSLTAAMPIFALIYLPWH